MSWMSIFHYQHFFNFMKRASRRICSPKMSKDEIIKHIETKAERIEAMAEKLEEEVKQMQGLLEKMQTSKRNEELKKEKEELKKEIERYRAILTNKPLTLPNDPVIKMETATLDVEQLKTKKPTPKKREDGGSTNKNNNKATNDDNEAPVDVGRLDFRVGKIVSVKKHPDADTLYVEEIDVGEGKLRQVVSGLVKHVPITEMENRMVIVLCNLKPAKMRGVTSEAMVMCASSPDRVEILKPPEGSMPGDVIHVDGFVRNPDSVLNPKKKVFEMCAPDLKTDHACVATFRGVPWCVAGKGPVTAQSLAGVLIK